MSLSAKSSPSAPMSTTSSRRHRQRRRPRRLRPLPQLPRRPAPSLRIHPGCRRQSPRRICRVHLAADDQYLAAPSRHQSGSCRHLRSLRQRRAHGPVVSCARRRRADHRRRPDRHHGHPRRAPRRSAPRRDHRSESLPARSCAQDGRDARRQSERDAARPKCKSSSG